MPPGEIFVPAVLTDLQTINPGEIRLVRLTLPDHCEIEGTEYPVRDVMRPGNAFLAKPFGERSGKVRRRMYTRSNCSRESARAMETIINHTHQEKADTSIWWQGEQMEELYREGKTVDVRVDFNKERTELVLYENSGQCKPTNLRLEPDGEWETMRFLGVALSTGITPFLAHLSYMAAVAFGRSESNAGSRYTLIVSVRNPRQLMKHAELLDLERRFPRHFKYFPVLTREWPHDWPYGRGRIIRVKDGNGRGGEIDLGPLREVVPDLQANHVRYCGNRTGRDQLLKGLDQLERPALSIRSDVW